MGKAILTLINHTSFIRDLRSMEEEVIIETGMKIGKEMKIEVNGVTKNSSLEGRWKMLFVISAATKDTTQISVTKDISHFSVIKPDIIEMHLKTNFEIPLLSHSTDFQVGVGSEFLIFPSLLQPSRNQIGNHAVVKSSNSFFFN